MKNKLTWLLLFVAAFFAACAPTKHFVLIDGSSAQITGVQDYRLVNGVWSKVGGVHACNQTIVHSTQSLDDSLVQDFTLTNGNWLKTGAPYKRPDTVTVMHEYFWSN